MTKTFIKTFCFYNDIDADSMINDFIYDYYKQNKINLSVASIEYYGNDKNTSDYMVRMVIVFEYEYDRITTSYYLTDKDGNIADQLNKIMKDYNDKKLNAHIINISHHRSHESILDDLPESLFVIIEHDEE